TVTGTSFGTIFNPAQSASANSQVETAVHIAPTYSDGSFTGSVHTPLLIDWDGTSHFGVSDIIGAGTLSFHASSTPSATNYFLSENGTNTIINAPSATG